MLNRRQFLRSGLRSAMGLGLASVVPLSVFSSMSASASEEYRAVICVLLAGGADSFNILVNTATIKIADLIWRYRSPHYCRLMGSTMGHNLAFILQ